MACNVNLHRVSGMQVMMIALGDGNCKPLPRRQVSELPEVAGSGIAAASEHATEQCL